jgi:hypothetical protein
MPSPPFGRPFLPGFDSRRKRGPNRDSSLVRRDMINQMVIRSPDAMLELAIVLQSFEPVKRVVGLHADLTRRSRHALKALPFTEVSAMRQGTRARPARARR